MHAQRRFVCSQTCPSLNISFQRVSSLGHNVSSSSSSNLQDIWRGWAQGLVCESALRTGVEGCREVSVRRVAEKERKKEKQGKRFYEMTKKKGRKVFSDPTCMGGAREREWKRFDFYDLQDRLHAQCGLERHVACIALQLRGGIGRVGCRHMVHQRRLGRLVDLQPKKETNRKTKQKRNWEIMQEN